MKILKKRWGNLARENENSRKQGKFGGIFGAKSAKKLRKMKFREMKFCGKLEMKFAGGIFGVFAIFAMIFGAATIFAQNSNFAHAANEKIDLAISTQSGTPDFDSLDENAENSVIRTSDYIIWNVSPTFHGTQTGAKIEITTPRGVYFDNIPQMCDGANTKMEISDDGETWTEGLAKTPDSNLTADMWKTLPFERLTCGIKDSNDNTSLNYALAAKVWAGIPDKTPITAKISVFSDQVAAQEKSQTYSVASTPAYEISKNGYLDPPNSAGNYWSSRAGACTTDKTRLCWQVYWYIVIFANAQKGISPATEFTFTDDVSAKNFFPNMTDEQLAKINADPEKYGVRFKGASAMLGGGYGMPYGKIGAYPQANAENSVRNTGNVSCAQAGGAGTKISCTVSGGDYSGFTYPTKNAENQAVAAKYAVATLTMMTEIPYDTFHDLGVTSGENASSWVLNFKNTLENFAATDLTGQTVAEGADYLANNSRAINATLSSGGSFSKVFAGVPGTYGNTPSDVYSHSDQYLEGPAGDAPKWSGDAKVFPGQDVISLISGSDYAVEENQDRTYVACDYWDNSQLNLHAREYPKNTLVGQNVASGGAAVWVSSANWGGATPANANLQVWYSSDSTKTKGGQCGDDDANWYSDINDPALKNDQSKVSDGVYTGINMVRVAFTLKGNPSVNSSGIRVSIGQKLVDGQLAGTKISNYASYQSGINKTAQQIISEDKWNVSGFNPDTMAGYAGGDRVLVANIQASINKQILQAANQGGNWTDANTEVTINQTRKFRLIPSLMSPVPSAETPSLMVEDCLPAGFTMVDSNYDFTSTPDENSHLTCKTGETYIRWNLGARAVKDEISPIEYDVKIEPTVANGTYINTARITAVGDPADEEPIRTDTQEVRVLNPSGIYISKSPKSPQIQVNPAQNSAKEDISWRIDSVNVGPIDGMSNMDMIDILPENGVDFAKNMGMENSAASNFSGDYKLTKVEKNSGGDVKVYYSTKPAKDLKLDLNDLSNSTDGIQTSTAPHVVNEKTWTLAENLAEIPENATALRFKLDDKFSHENQFSYEITITPSGNLAGDTYVNSMAATQISLQNDDEFAAARSLGPIQSPVETVGAKIGNFVWRDENADGIQDETEKGIANLEVKLSGKDDLGNAVNLTTKTDENGEYSFENLRAADENGYEILIAKPSDFPTNFAISGAGEDEEKDSNADKNGEIQSVKISAGEENESFDAGIIVEKCEWNSEIFADDENCVAPLTEPIIPAAPNTGFSPKSFANFK